MNIPKVSFVGYSNSGKTTLVVEVITELKKRGYKVATVKHHHEDVETDLPGKDTWKFTKAGADTVISAGLHKIAVTHQLEETVQFQQVMDLITNVDLIIVEGFKKERISKIEVFRKDMHPQPIFSPKELLAIVAAEPIEGLTTFSPQDIMGLVDFLQQTFELCTR